jgi:putative SOS response-associated peptidase YedK
MCGRYSLTHTAEELARRFQLEELPRLAPRYNIAPTQPILIVREDRHRNGVREAAHVVWGLIPPWASDTTIASRMINARAETAASKPAFRHAFRRRRCLVPASGFFEWKKKPLAIPEPEADLFAGMPAEMMANSSTKTGSSPAISLPKSSSQKFSREPHLIRLADGELFAFAGLWEVWNGPNGETIESATILTTSANPVTSAIHDRMPVILAPETYNEWLSCENEETDRLANLLCPYPAEKMEVYAVSSIVNSPRNDEPGCIAPLARR